MKKYFYILVLSYCSYIFSSESEVTLDISKESKSMEKTLPVSSNNGIYILPSFDRFLPGGIAYRHHMNDTRFYEISFANRKLVIIESYLLIDNGLSTEAKKFGEDEFIYNNMLNVTYGFIYNSRYVKPYFSVGAGAFFPYSTKTSFFLNETLPTISSSAGFEFGFGFLDFTMSYLPKKWTHEAEVSSNDQLLNELGIKNEKIALNFLNDLRIGIGFRF